MDLYAENILDHFRHPRHKTVLAVPSVTHREVNTSCGDDLTLSLRIENDTIIDVGWEGQGCAISQAGMSLLSDWLMGKTASEAARTSVTDMQSLLGIDLGPRRLKCGMLALHALQNALRASSNLEPQAWSDLLRHTT
jgi:nitrogen fixation NifU-like protein